MRAVLMIVLLIYASKAECTMRCSDNSQSKLTFEPSEDKIEGRYKVEWCTQPKKNDTKWHLVLNYCNNENQSSCPQSRCIGSSHSKFELPVTINLNCTQVCFSNNLDLVFSNTCYHIQTFLKNENSKKFTYPSDFHHYITNNYTKQHFVNSVTLLHKEGYEDGLVSFKWYLGFVPATDFIVSVWENLTNKEINEQSAPKYNASCSVGGDMKTEVSCWARVPPDRCYNAWFHHTNTVPWTAAQSLFGRLANINGGFCVSTPDVAKASSSPAGEYSMAIGAAAVVLMVAAVLCFVRRRQVVAWKRRVRDRWLEITRKEPTEKPGASGDILLLYARDCAQFVCAAERLGALVRGATGRRVIDVYSGEATRLWAPAGDEWLRLMLARDDTRVLLLQSPAGTLLAANLAESRSGPALVAPLLGSLVWWRRPHAGDALLSLALRQLTSAPRPEPYRKHFVANISGLGADMAPGVTPQRRYTLPDAVMCLLRDLAPDLEIALEPDKSNPNVEPGLKTEPDLNDKLGPEFVGPKLMKAPVLDLEPLVRQFNEAADAFVDHVRDDPDYLADQLLFK